MQSKVAVSACIVGAAAKEVGASWSSWILSCAARKMGESSISSIIYTVMNDVNKRE
jgi:hypothetical protein